MAKSPRHEWGDLDREHRQVCDRCGASRQYVRSPSGKGMRAVYAGKGGKSTATAPPCRGR